MDKDDIHSANERRGGRSAEALARRELAGDPPLADALTTLAHDVSMVAWRGLSVTPELEAALLELVPGCVSISLELVGERSTTFRWQADLTQACEPGEPTSARDMAGPDLGPAHGVERRGQVTRWPSSLLPLPAPPPASSTQSLSDDPLREVCMVGPTDGGTSGPDLARSEEGALAEELAEELAGELAEELAGEIAAAAEAEANAGAVLDASVGFDPNVMEVTAGLDDLALGGTLGSTGFAPAPVLHLSPPFAEPLASAIAAGLVADGDAQAAADGGPAHPAERDLVGDGPFGALAAAVAPTLAAGVPPVVAAAAAVATLPVPLADPAEAATVLGDIFSRVSPNATADSGAASPRDHSAVHSVEVVAAAVALPTPVAQGKALAVRTGVEGDPAASAASLAMAPGSPTAVLNSTSSLALSSAATLNGAASIDATGIQPKVAPSFSADAERGSEDGGDGNRASLAPTDATAGGGPGRAELDGTEPPSISLPSSSAVVGCGGLGAALLPPSVAPGPTSAERSPPAPPLGTSPPLAPSPLPGALPLTPSSPASVRLSCSPRGGAYMLQSELALSGELLGRVAVLVVSNAPASAGGAGETAAAAEGPPASSSAPSSAGASPHSSRASTSSATRAFEIFSGNLATVLGSLRKEEIEESLTLASETFKSICLAQAKEASAVPPTQAAPPPPQSLA